MANLSTSNLLWYIYQRNCTVGYPTVISMSQFRYEFPDVSRRDIGRELNNLINKMCFVRRRFLCVYDLTEDGLNEVLHLQRFVVVSCPNVWWVSILQKAASQINKPFKAITVVLLILLACCSVLGSDTNKVETSITQLPVFIDSGLQLSNSMQNVSIQERRICELVAKAEALVAQAEGFLPQKVECMSCEYKSKLKKRLGEIDVEIGGAVRDREFYAKRYEVLKSEYSDAYKNLRDDYDKFVGRLGHWLTGIGIFVALLGIFVPVFATLVQWKNIKTGISDLKQGKDKELSNLRKDSVRALHMSLLQGVQNVDTGVPLSNMDKANVICSMVICFDDLLECAMRTKDGNMVKDEVAAFRPFLSRWSNSDKQERIDIWVKSEALLKEAMRSRKGLSRREDFAELLGEDSEIFKWLEAFYRKFADWKFA